MPTSEKTHYDYALICRMATYNHSECLKGLKTDQKFIHDQRAQYLHQQGWKPLPTSEKLGLSELMFPNIADEDQYYVIAESHQYFGVAYYKQDPATQHITEIVIGHRGTQFNQGNLVADLQIAERKAPVILAKAVLPYIIGLKKHIETNYFQHLIGTNIENIKITHTGFSLGGFIAAAKVTSIEANVYAVTFDAPGIDFLKPDESRSSCIINYVTRPNLVNTCNKHLGKIRQLSNYRQNSNSISPDIVNALKKGLILSLNLDNPHNFPIYSDTKNSHDMDNIINPFNLSQTIEYKEITQWPTAIIKPVYGPNPSVPKNMFHFGSASWSAFLLSGFAVFVQGSAYVASGMLWEMTKKLGPDGKYVGITHVKYKRDDIISYTDTPTVVTSINAQDRSVVPLSIFADASHRGKSDLEQRTHNLTQTDNSQHSLRQKRRHETDKEETSSKSARLTIN